MGKKRKKKKITKKQLLEKIEFLQNSINLTAEINANKTEIALLLAQLDERNCVGMEIAKNAFKTEICLNNNTADDAGVERIVALLQLSRLQKPDFVKHCADFINAYYHQQCNDEQEV